MFEGLLKRKFYTKSKSAIKLTKTRIEMIKRKRNVMQKYLKNDISDLLKNGLDANAYGRIEGFWNELNLSSCYDYVEQFCVHISSHLAAMSKQSECPEDCREAVSSLMIAAARFADLPELRELRTVFTERFGHSIECYVNKEFANKFKSTPPTKDMKLQLIQDIALESGIEWNSKALEQKLYNPPGSERDSAKNGNTKEINIPMTDAVQTIHNRGAKHNKDPSECTAPEREVKYLSSCGMKESMSDEEPENAGPIQDIQVNRINRKKQQDEPQIVRSASGQEEHDDKKPFSYKSIPPPYTISKISKMSLKVPPTGTDIEGPEHKNTNSNIDREDDQDDSVGKTKRIPKSVRSRNLNSHPGQGRKVLSDKDHDQHDEEERMMDRLLLHYSKKTLPDDTKETGGDGLPNRTSSLPAESSPTEATKKHARASSLEPEMLNSHGHVHPKLPDYDDFVARLAALRGN